MLNPRSYITPELWTQAMDSSSHPEGNHEFEPLADARNIMVIGGAGFMCVLYSQPCQPQLLNGHSGFKIRVIQLEDARTLLTAVLAGLFVI